MSLLVLLWSCFLSVVLICSGSFGSALGGNETDRLALLAFKAEITGPLGVLSSWNESIHFCQWSGVACGRRHQRVVVLYLDDQGLSGSISPHIGNLSFLKELWLRNNSLSHIIPPELGFLRRLRILSLRNNSVSGEIPANISASSGLTVLDLNFNRLAGKIPDELGSLTNLEKLNLGKNSLTGSIPSTFGNLSSLELFAALQNSISGNIPDVLGRLKNLQALGLANNRLVGTIPSSFFNLSSIQALDVGSNQMHGSFPSDLGITLPNLQFFAVSSNLFTGSIPFSLSNASKLQILSFGNNQFTGRVPPLGKLHDLWSLSFSRNHLGTGEAHDLSFIPSLTNATHLSLFALNANNFGGVFPESIRNFSTNLSILAMDNNKITGNIPTGIENLVNLEILHLWNNQLTGKIPSNIGKFQRLQSLSLSGNKFSGNIPSSLGNLSLITKLYLDENYFYGNIPSDLGKCKLLNALSLDGNNLNGTIPREVMSLSSLLNLTVSENHLTGSLPVEVGNLKNLEVLDVSKNKLSGKLPSTLDSCVKLRLLYVEDNNFQGMIPTSLSYLRGMEELDLSCNNLSGELPNFLGDFVYLRKLNLSFNGFEGAVPERGIFRNASAVSVEGNNRLCGGISELHLHHCNSKASKRKRYTLLLKLIIPITFCLVGLVLMLCFLYRSRFRKRMEVPSSRILGNAFQRVSYQSLFEATGGFSPANLIGVGGFGSVYRGILDQDAKVVAVKVLNLEFHGASKSFIAECKALKNMRHRNLVKVITTCSSIDNHGKDFKALVYEFMVNGSLEDWLHPNENEEEANKDSRNLNLLQRLNIAIDVASAIDYLHNHCPEPMAHCDLKPSNVLLDHEMTGHVGDFGLARFFPEAIYGSSTYQSSSIGIRGSIGYAAPEYGMGNEVTKSGDVYSYGILLLEMFTGRRPTDNKFSNSLSIHNFVKMALLEQKIEGIADPTLLQQREKAGENSSRSITQHQDLASKSQDISECLISILQIGITCSEELPRDRIAINDAVAQLLAIRNTHFGGTSGVLRS
ncbi:probable LRR receptor-like serine/threonine-protein kinase At3g47570 [Actinidia eriantha]|uniref:probable LRR receptor-like serine/threonine-protein kinase At3g47570 n=1 Tax=Actinidia eriantha TaxID=165200 RepID=UPI002582B791|nr:probable LRR receptor-like serine/threonine-protein kinase At3g47570 [Actinidia eriantha]